MPDQKKLTEAQHNLIHHNVLIMWKPEYNLGIPIVDEQHRGVVATINSLYYGMQNKHADTMLRPVIEMINNYTTIHFETEEDFLKKCGYPDLEQHLELHNELKKKLSSVGKKSIWEQDPSQFMEFLKTWWIDHICKKDWLFRDYLLK